MLCPNMFNLSFQGFLKNKYYCLQAIALSILPGTKEIIAVNVLGHGLRIIHGENVIGGTYFNINLIQTVYCTKHLQPIKYPARACSSYVIEAGIHSHTFILM